MKHYSFLTEEYNVGDFIVTYAGSGIIIYIDDNIITVCITDPNTGENKTITIPNIYN